MSNNSEILIPLSSTRINKAKNDINYLTHKPNEVINENNYPKYSIKINSKISKDKNRNIKYNHRILRKNNNTIITHIHSLLKTSPFCETCGAFYFLNNPQLKITSSIKPKEYNYTPEISVTQIIENLILKSSAEHMEIAKKNIDIKNIKIKEKLFNFRRKVIKNLKNFHMKICLFPKTFFIFSSIFDRIIWKYLCKSQDNCIEIYKKLELISLSCYFLSVKFNDKAENVFNIKEFKLAFEPANAYSTSQIRKYELFCLKSVGFKLNWITFFDVVDIFRANGIIMSSDLVNKKLTRNFPNLLNNFLNKIIYHIIENNIEYIYFNQYKFGCAVISFSRKFFSLEKWPSSYNLIYKIEENDFNQEFEYVKSHYIEGNKNYKENSGGNNINRNNNNDIDIKNYKKNDNNKNKINLNVNNNSNNNTLIKKVFKRNDSWTGSSKICNEKRIAYNLNNIYNHIEDNINNKNEIKKKNVSNISNNNTVKKHLSIGKLYIHERRPKRQSSGSSSKRIKYSSLHCNNLNSIILSDNEKKNKNFYEKSKEQKININLTKNKEKNSKKNEHKYINQSMEMTRETTARHNSCHYSSGKKNSSSLNRKNNSGYQNDNNCNNNNNNGIINCNYNQNKYKNYIKNKNKFINLNNFYDYCKIKKNNNKILCLKKEPIDNLCSERVSTKKAKNNNRDNINNINNNIIKINNDNNINAKHIEKFKNNSKIKSKEIYQKNCINDFNKINNINVINKMTKLSNINNLNNALNPNNITSNKDFEELSFNLSELSLTNLRICDGLSTQKNGNNRKNSTKYGEFGDFKYKLNKIDDIKLKGRNKSCADSNNKKIININNLNYYGKNLKLRKSKRYGSKRNNSNNSNNNNNDNANIYSNNNITSNNNNNFSIKKGKCFTKKKLFNNSLSKAKNKSCSDIYEKNRPSY